MKTEILKNLQPVEVFKYFEEISEIPRGSGNEKEVSDYLVGFAKQHNLEVIQDEALNVIIKKKATPEYENSPTVVIQGHMDMVCEKNGVTKHDFTKESLKLKIVDDMIYAEGTTLGADNGIAVAMGLALLASKEIDHPAIELVLTAAEETGMDGAMKLDPKNLDGRILMNIDSEDEGTFFVSCAGGPTVKTIIPVIWEEVDQNLVPYAVRIRGLKGGHSGMEIDKGRANSNKLMGRILMTLSAEVNFSVASLNGGLKYNAIPREMDAVILIKPEDKAKVSEKLSELENVFKNEFRTSEPHLKVEFEVVTEKVSKVFSTETMSKTINYLYLAENGINSMSMDIEGLVESSLSLGVVITKETEIEFISLIRSSVKSLYMEILQRIDALAKLIGAKIVIQSNCPEWTYNPNSKIRTICEEVYNKMYGKKPEITAIHVGLECGIFNEKFNGEMDIISFGPNIYDIHTPDEHISISSVKRSWDFLLEVLKSVK